MLPEYEVIQAQAEANALKMDELLGGNPNAQAIKIMEANVTRKQRVIRLQALATALSHKITPHSACKNGCDHCCKMAVSVTEIEAKQIAEYLGTRYMRHPKTLPVLEARERYVNNPCPMLKDGRCSIYEVRPMACRTYFNLSDTPDVCDTSRYPDQDVPCLDMRGFQIAQSVLMGTDFADIREWFPQLQSIAQD